MPLQIVSHPDYDAGFAPEHRFPMSKYGHLMDRLGELGLIGGLTQAEPIAAARLHLAHDADYVGQVLACSVPAHIEREIGFPVGERVSRRAQLAAGGTLAAAHLALAHGVACNAAGGSHHARRAQGAGFCTFNDVAIAALALLDGRLVGSVLVVDLDVHQGDGTAEILGGNPDVFTFSMHAEKNYPVRKVASGLDIGLPDGTGDDVYLEILVEALARLSRRGEWDLVFYNAGVDPHREDRLGRLALSDDGLRRRERMVIEHFRDAGIPLCAVIGGGYSTDVAALAARHAILFETASAFA
ncbi:histone deacetylase [Aminobacter sp. AP02]|uniref:histone deacetylase family protein n=1 Tax=Aminobacter sp. AP02 TaxID=2135737 RepID=UPI000D6C73B3|nr:histone deacetylase [Aminobacter sp. AP02]PWK64095.1 acetoin utilization deacetylase AcuC-like enzyme [Aminobacter sp. AP02]